MLTDHIAILTQSAIATPAPNRKKPQAPHQFFALLAFPPAAFPDIKAQLEACAAANNVGLRAGQKMGVILNSQKQPPLPGIPAEWWVLRAATQFAPEAYDLTARPVDRNAPDAVQRLRGMFYPGKRVRAQVTPYYWPNEGGGFSWNLNAIMDAGEGGDRIQGIGGGADPTAFQKHAKPVAAAVNSGAGAADPFVAAQAAQPAQAATQSADPFAQAAAPASANPFLAPAA